MLVNYIKNYNIFIIFTAFPYLPYIYRKHLRHTRQATKPTLGYLNKRRGMAVLHRKISSKRLKKRNFC